MSFGLFKTGSFFSNIMGPLCDSSVLHCCYQLEWQIVKTLCLVIFQLLGTCRHLFIYRESVAMWRKSWGKSREKKKMIHDWRCFCIMDEIQTMRNVKRFVIKGGKETQKNQHKTLLILRFFSSFFLEKTTTNKLDTI